jgi:hypothetical protein
MASLFDTLQAQAFRAGITARTKKSQKWFRDKIEDMKAPDRRALLKDDALEPTTRELRGSMYMYFYDPKHKKTLPYYDRFPLVLLIEQRKGGFLGLNLHYLRPDIRAKFLDELMKLSPGKITDKSRLMKARYDLISSTRKYKEFRPCLKMYLSNHVKSRMVRVPMSEWEIAIFLPTEQFKKSQKSKIWADSIKIARQT